jgi:hypothetical protein
MAKRSKLRLGPTVVIGALTVLACVGIGFIYVDSGPDETATIIGYVAMGLGFMAAILLGVALVLLIHHDRRSD